MFAATESHRQQEGERPPSAAPAGSAAPGYETLLCGMAAAGFGLEALSFYLGLAQIAILEAVLRLGTLLSGGKRRRRPAGPRAWTPFEIRVLAAAWLKGVRAGCIAFALGRSRAAIYAQRRRLGLPARERKGLIEIGAGELLREAQGWLERPAEFVVEDPPQEGWRASAGSEPAAPIASPRRGAKAPARRYGARPGGSRRKPGAVPPTDAPREEKVERAGERAAAAPSARQTTALPAAPSRKRRGARARKAGAAAVKSGEAKGGQLNDASGSPLERAAEFSSGLDGEARQKAPRAPETGERVSDRAAGAHGGAAARPGRAIADLNPDLFRAQVERWVEKAKKAGCDDGDKGFGHRKESEDSWTLFEAVELCWRRAGGQSVEAIAARMGRMATSIEPKLSRLEFKRPPGRGGPECDLEEAVRFWKKSRQVPAMCHGDGRLFFCREKRFYSRRFLNGQRCEGRRNDRFGLPAQWDGV